MTGVQRTCILVAPHQGSTQGAGLLLFARSTVMVDSAREVPRLSSFCLGGKVLVIRPHRISGVPQVIRIPKPTEGMSVERTTTRKPMLLFLLFGLFLLRYAQRAFL